MKNVMSAILVALAFSLISIASAGSGSSKKSPESIVICGVAGVNVYGVVGQSISEAINADLCEAGSTCAPCIISLEDQGCKIVDVVVDIAGRPQDSDQVVTTYLLSCVKP